MSKVTDDWDKWAEEAEHLTYRFQLAVDYNQRDDEFATAWDMMEFLQETVAALKSNAPLYPNNNPLYWKQSDFISESSKAYPEYDGRGGPDKEGWDD